MTTGNRLRLAVIIGSVRKGRIGPSVAKWFAAQAAEHEGFDVDLVDLADYDLPAVLTDEPSPEVVASLSEFTPRLAGADAFVVVTPEYNHSYPASLKCAIDWHFTEWQAKPIGFVSYGGVAAGSRAVEHLRQVFAELHAVTVRDTVGFSGPWGRFGEDGTLTDPAEANTAAKTLLDQLRWWGDALRQARERVPYQA
ncbi:NADPH-dependent FMN reductase [Amycolatopsis sp. cg5]|uniref:NADPH-dependent FMN reductase n=1 Tax=Amycolatopsis sp. cg5 TaxID=3238802 RepID=UPI0035252278